MVYKISCKMIRILVNCIKKSLFSVFTFLHDNSYNIRKISASTHVIFSGNIPSFGKFWRNFFAKNRKIPAEYSIIPYFNDTHFFRQLRSFSKETSKSEKFIGIFCISISKTLALNKIKISNYHFWIV